MLLNVYKDEEDEFSKFKLLLSFINPEAAQKIFSKTQITEEVVESDDFLEEVSSHTHVSSEALKDLLNSPDGEDLDIIEPAS
jgi:hypothetical protein